MNGRTILEWQCEQDRLDAEEERRELEIESIMDDLFGWDTPSKDKNNTQTDGETMNDEENDTDKRTDTED